MAIDKKKDCNWDDWPWKGDKRGKVYFSVRNIDSQKVNNISFLLIIWIIFQPSKLKIIPSNSHATISKYFLWEHIYFSKNKFNWQIMNQYNSHSQMIKKQVQGIALAILCRRLFVIYI